MLITGHSSDPSKIFPAFAKIAIVSHLYAFVCADFAAAVTLSVPSVCSSILMEMVSPTYGDKTPIL
jgi:hypothetical protein